MPRKKQRKLLESVPNCWEHEDCPEEVRKSCPAYPDMGKECWKITGTRCAQGKYEYTSLSEKIIYCRNHCRYYRDHIKKVFP
jgi:hypothetical protein